MSVVDLFRELARPARHDHRRLTPTQHAIEAVARVAATGLVLAVHRTARTAVGVVDTARAARTITHLLRDR